MRTSIHSIFATQEVEGKLALLTICDHKPFVRFEDAMHALLELQWSTFLEKLVIMKYKYKGIKNSLKTQTRSAGVAALTGTYLYITLYNPPPPKKK